MAALCRALGLDVGHEQMGADGVSSWMMGPPVWRVPFHREWNHRGRLWYQFDRVIEVVRDPLPHIASVAFTESSGGADQATSLWWRAAWVPLEISEVSDPIVQAVQSIVGWHAMMAEWFPRRALVRLDMAEDDVPTLLDRCYSSRIPGVVNPRDHAPVSWATLRSRCSGPLWAALMLYCDELGYERPRSEAA